MLISETKKALNAIDKTKPVYFDFGGLVPTTIASWRGIYAEPALGCKENNGEEPTVSDLLNELKIATSGKTYCGWKGGDFKYSDSDILHVDNPGEYTNTEISGVLDDGWRVVLQTFCESD